MKVITLVIFGVLFVSGTAYAGTEIIRGIEFARVGIISDPVSVYKVVDGETTCYVTRHGKFGAHAISCVK